MYTTMKLLSLLLLTLFLALAPATVDAAPIDCNSGIVDVTGIPADGCQTGSLIFDDFSVSSLPAGATVGILSAVDVAGTVYLNFSVTPGLSPLDVLLQYSVTAETGNIFGVDLGSGTLTGLGFISEIVCDDSGFIAPGSSTCDGTQLAGHAVLPGDHVVSGFAPQTMIWIAKDVQLIGDPVATISDFTNSHETGGVVAQEGDIPEPITMILMGSGLLALGVVRKYKVKA